MTKKQRSDIIRKLMDEVRKNIVVKNEMQLMRLELLKRKENNAIEENSDKAVEEIREFVEMEKFKMKKYPALGLKSQWIDEEFVVTKL